VQRLLEVQVTLLQGLLLYHLAIHLLEVLLMHHQDHHLPLLVMHQVDHLLNLPVEAFILVVLLQAFLLRVNILLPVPVTLQVPLHLEVLLRHQVHHRLTVPVDHLLEAPVLLPVDLLRTVRQ
jgi:hypothetical protein